VKQFITSLFDTVTQRLHQDTVPVDDPVRLRQVRRAMVDLVGDDESWEAEQLRHRLLVAESARALWFMRPEVLQWLCRTQDERDAMVRVLALQPLFEGLIEPALLGASPGRRRRHGPFHGA
jgi:hypothetical protein